MDRKSVEKRKRLPETDVFLDSIAPLAKLVRVTYELPVKRLFQVYRGTSAYGPCVFYHHRRTDTWIVLCRNQTRTKRLLPILTSKTAQNPLVCSTVRNLLGNPAVIPSDEKADYEASKTWDVFLPGFQRAGGHCSGPWRELFRTMGTDYNKEASIKFSPIQSALNDGDIIWATWRPSSTLRQAVRERFPEDVANHILSMAGDLPQTGFTGFFKSKLILEDGGKVVRCRNNTHFWVKRLEGPTHYWEEEQNYDFHFPIESQETQVQPEDDDDDASDED